MLRRRSHHNGACRHPRARARCEDQPGRVSLGARREADGDVLREGIAAHPLDVSDGDEHPWWVGAVRRSDQLAARRARIAGRYRPQCRAVGADHRAAHLRARDHHRDGAVRERAGDQRAQRSGTPLPGDRRLYDPRRALRQSARLQLHLRRRRQQCLPLVDADRGSSRRALYRRRAEKLCAQGGHRRPGARHRQCHRLQHHGGATIP